MRQSSGDGSPTKRGRSATIWLGVLLVGALILGALYFAGGSSSPDETSSALEASDVEAQPDVTDSELQEPESSEVDSGLTESVEIENEPSTAREPARTPLIRGIVQDDNGTNLENATVTWTAWDPQYLDFVTSAVLIPPSVLRARTVSAITSAEGEFAFDTAPPLDPGEPSIIWVTHPDHLAKSIELEADQSSLNDLQRIELPSSPRVNVRVLENGSPANEAVVDQQHAFPRDTAAQYMGGGDAPKALLVFLRTHDLGTRGVGAIAPSEARLHLTAERSTKKSMPWEGLGREWITLSLAEEFELSGTVDLPAEIDEQWGRARIQVVRYRASLVEEVASIPVREDGSFGPAPIPNVPADEFRARLQGNEFIVTEQAFVSPGAGGNVAVHLVAEIGFAKWFLVEDDLGAPLEGAEVLATWERNGATVEKSAKSRSDGYVMISGIPEGSILGVARADGFALFHFGPALVPLDPPRPLRIGLRKGRSLNGRCLRGIQPAPNFEVRYWDLDNPSRRSSLSVLDSEDGAFSITDLPSHRIALTAITPEFERCEPVIIDLETTELQEVVLHLEPPGVLEGRVVDGSTGEPIPDATLEVFSSRLYTEMESIGAPARAGDLGEFEMARLSRGINLIAIRAPGFSDRELKVFVQDGTSTDLGDIELYGRQTLTASLSLGEGEDPSEWALHASGIGAIPTTLFYEQGRIVIEDASAGAWYFEVRDYLGQGRILATQHTWLKPGEDWHLEFDFRGGHALVLEVVNESGEPLVGDFEARVECLGAAGLACSRVVPLDADGIGFLPGGVFPGPVFIEILQGSLGWRRVGAQLARVSKGDPLEILLEVPVSDRSTRVRVVDEDRRALPGVLVVVRSSSQPDSQLANAMTDGNGIVDLESLPAQADRVDLTSPSGGLHHGIEFEVPDSSAEPIEIVFESSASIHVRLVDGTAPQTSVTARLWSRESGINLSSGQTPDETGRLAFKDLSPGEYELRVSGADHWAVRTPVSAADSTDERSIQIRRVGAMRLEFVSANGMAHADQPIDLEHLATGESAQAWLDLGLLHGLAGSLRTNELGVLALPRVPHGEYRWTAGGISGTVTVSPGQELRKRLLLP